MTEKTSKRAAAAPIGAAAIAKAKEEKEQGNVAANIAPAGGNSVEASGAIIEDEVKDGIDVDHAAVDNNPRAHTTARQNQIDFNDPTKTDYEVVQEKLEEQK